jgi:hypothetical protein
MTTMPSGLKAVMSVIFDQGCFFRNVTTSTSR